MGAYVAAARVVVEAVAATPANSLAPADHNSLNNNTGSSNISSHPITAVYSGDSTYLGSTSPVLNQVVAKTFQGLFFDNETFKAGTSGTWVDGTVGDFNGDGIPDIAA